MRHRRIIGPALASFLALGCRPSDPVATPASEPAPPQAAAEQPPSSSFAAETARQAAWKAHSDAQRPRFTCPSGSPALGAARTEHAALDTAIAALGDLDDPAPLVRRIEALLDSPCLGLARVHAIPLRAESGLALRLWRERGGLVWLDGALRFSEGSLAAVELPPTMPITLSRETHPDHPLSPWLCSLHDPVCAATTAGWRERGQQVMAGNDEIRYVLEQYDDARRCHQWAVDYYEDFSHPEGTLRVLYPHWVRCMFKAEGNNTEFPLGGLRAPDAGWLVVEGRRGHYEFCDELHAYELETGAAHVVRSCSGLVLGNDGGVDEAAIEKGHAMEVERGMVPRDNVRELAFMLLVADHVRSPAIPKLTSLPVPAGVDLPASASPLAIAEPDEWGGSNETELSWRLVPPTGPAIEGTFSWPPGYNHAPKRHAANLWSVVEKGIVPGCPARSLPAALPLSPTLSGVSPIDATSEALDDSHDKLVAALRDEPKCARSKRKR